MNHEKRQILTQALSEMPQFFTSREFGHAVRMKGGDQYSRTGALTKFLNDYTKKLGGQRWEKINGVKISPTITDQDAINHLKSKGYKIFKSIEV